MPVEFGEPASNRVAPRAGRGQFMRQRVPRLPEGCHRATALGQVRSSLFLRALSIGHRLLNRSHFAVRCSSFLLRRLRLAAPQWHGELRDAVKRAKALGAAYDGRFSDLTVRSGGEFAVYAEVVR